MKKTALISVIALLALLLAAAGCDEKATTTTHSDASPDMAAHSEGDGHDHGGAPAEAEAAAWNGTIAETMNSGGYTYALVDLGSEQIWVAGPQTTVEVGQKVTVPKGMMMANFPSKTLDRTFDEIYFVGGIFPEGAAPAAGGGMGGMGGTGNMPQDSNHAGMGMGGTSGGSNDNTKVGNAEVEGVSKVAGGYTVKEIFAQKAALGGQPVKVRGQVVKFSPNIMGTNWVHIQDGSGGDLTVTTDATVATGDVVVVSGNLTVNKDFGAGYKYDAIIEKASVTKE